MEEELQVRMWPYEIETKERALAVCHVLSAITCTKNPDLLPTERIPGQYILFPYFGKTDTFVKMCFVSGDSHAEMISDTDTPVQMVKPEF
ncbi:MAG: hypothetical protein EOM06_10635 [Sphingobacteriia bacterium]|nr:hypothetical protein [Sphingobacteriia bacterium]